MNEHPYHVADALHVHGQENPHDPVFIIGPRAQLLLLRRAIDQALAGHPQSASLFTADGEGYRLVVVPVEDMRDAMLPYRDGDRRGPGEDGAAEPWAGRSPHDLLGPETCRALLMSEPTLTTEEIWP